MVTRIVVVLMKVTVSGCGAAVVTRTKPLVEAKLLPVIWIVVGTAAGTTTLVAVGGAGGTATPVMTGRLLPGAGSLMTCWPDAHVEGKANGARAPAGLRSSTVAVAETSAWSGGRGWPGCAAPGARPNNTRRGGTMTRTLVVLAVPPVSDA